MKVIQVIPNLGMGGAEIMCETLTLELVKKGIDVMIISLYSGETPITKRLIQAGIRIEFLGKKSGLDLSMIRKLKNIFKAENPDVVHSHLNAQKYAMIAAKQVGVPVCIHTVHNVAEKELSRIDKIIAKIFYKKKLVVPVALSELIHQTIVSVYGDSLKCVPIVFNGINLAKCQPKDDYNILENVKILHIGRFFEQKNHIGLIKAFSIFHKRYPNSQLQLIGDGEKKREIEKIVQDYGLANNVEFFGVQNNVYGYLHNADIFTLPSLYEGIPMTLIEAMGTGLPIVATNVGGVPDMLTDGESAILTLVDEEELANAFIRLTGDEWLRKKLGEEAKRESLKFSSEIMAKKYVGIYEGIEIEIKN